MKKLLALTLTLLMLTSSLLCLTAYAADDVTFEGDFNNLTLIVGKGTKDDILKDITAKDTATGEDLTASVTYAGSVDFNTVGEYPIMYIVTGKSAFKTRTIVVVENNTTSDLFHQKIDDYRNYLQGVDFESVKGTTRNLIYGMYTDTDYRTLKYSWLFRGSEIGDDYPARLSVTIYGEDNCANADEIIDAVGKVNYKILSFECGERIFPADAEITILVEDEFTTADSLYLYSYSDDKLVLLADSIKVNGAGYITYSFSKGGDYVLTDKKAGYQEPTSSAETSSKTETSSAPVSSAPVSSQAPVSSAEPESSTLPESSETTTSDDSAPTVSTISTETSSDSTPTDAPETSTVLLVIVLAAIGLMLITVIAFAAVRKNAR